MRGSTVTIVCGVVFCALAMVAAEVYEYWPTALYHVIFWSTMAQVTLARGISEKMGW